MSERQIERWWRYRRAQDKPSTLVKFCENSWRCMYYTYSFGFGVFVLWDKPWFWDVKHCWYGYPHQVSSWYYITICMLCICTHFSALINEMRPVFYISFKGANLYFFSLIRRSPVCRWWHLVVLHAFHGILLGLDGFTILWHQAKGLLANVHPSRGDVTVAVIELGL